MVEKGKKRRGGRHESGGGGGEEERVELESRTRKKRSCPIGELYGLGMGHSVALSDPL